MNNWEPTFDNEELVDLVLKDERLFEATFSGEPRLSVANSRLGFVDNITLTRKHPTNKSFRPQKLPSLD